MMSNINVMIGVKDMDSLKFICCMCLLSFVTDINAMQETLQQQRKQQLIAALGKDLHSSQMYAIESAARESKMYQPDRQRLIQFNSDYKLNQNKACSKMMSYLIENDLVFCGQQMRNLDPSQTEEFKDCINQTAVEHGWPSFNLIPHLCDTLPKRTSMLVLEYLNIITNED